MKASVLEVPRFALATGTDFPGHAAQMARRRV